MSLCSSVQQAIALHLDILSFWSLCAASRSWSQALEPLKSDRRVFVFAVNPEGVEEDIQGWSTWNWQTHEDKHEVTAVDYEMDVFQFLWHHTGPVQRPDSPPVDFKIWKVGVVPWRLRHFVRLKNHRHYIRTWHLEPLCELTCLLTSFEEEDGDEARRYAMIMETFKRSARAHTPAWEKYTLDLSTYLADRLKTKFTS